MMDHEKTDFLKAKLIADRNKEPKQPTDSKGLDPAKTIDSVVSLFTFMLGFISTYFTQSILFTKFSTIVPFGFWESLALYFCFTSSLKLLTNSIRLIGLSFRKS